MDAPRAARSDRAGSDDVRRLYRLFLGRSPETAQVVVEKQGALLDDIAAELSQSSEFRGFAASFLSGGDQARDDGRFPGWPTPQDLALAQRLVDENGLGAHDGDWTWRHLLQRVMARLNITPPAPPAVEAKSAAASLRAAFRLILGREADASTLTGPDGDLGAPALLRRLAGSPEFRGKVLDVLARNEAPDAPPGWIVADADAAAWARRQLRPRDPAAAQLAGARSWAGQLSALAEIDPALVGLRRGDAALRRLAQWAALCEAERPRRSAEEAAHRVDKAELANSGLFQAAWYHTTYPDTQVRDPFDHYLEYGGREGRRTSPFFDSAKYLQENPDVAAAGYNPLLHWLRYGRAEGRRPPVPLAPPPRQPTLTLKALCDPGRDEAPQTRRSPAGLVTILTPTFNTPPRLLRELHQTLRNQTCADWEWVVVDDASTTPGTINTLREMAKEDPRIVLRILDQPKGISGASNAGLEVARGAYVALVDHDDLLARDVLEKVGAAIAAHTGRVDIVYTDECKLNKAGEIFDIYLKPAWSPVLLQNTMYVGHLTIYRADFIRELGGFRSEFDGCQDYDLALRAAATEPSVVHVDVIGYVWRAIEGSTAERLDAKGYALKRQRRALETAARAVDPAASVRPGPSPGHWRVENALPRPPPRLSYVIPTAAGARMIRGRRTDLISHCIRSLIDSDFYPDAEYVVVHNCDLTIEQRNFLRGVPNLRLVAYEAKELNLAAKINLGVENASGDYVCLLNDDVEAISHSGGETIIAFMEAHPKVGAVAPLCLFEDGRTQHNGVILLEQGPSHAGILQSPHYPGHHMNLRLRREMFGVTGAMLFVRRDVYRQVGGFEERLPLNYNDVDFCLKLRREGLSCVVDPEVEVYHFESASKIGTFQCEKETFLSRWPGLSDPYFNPGFEQRDPSYVLADPATPTPGAGDAIAFTYWLDRTVAARARKPAEGPQITVGVSVYDQPAGLLREMLGSFRMQSYDNADLVIVDNGSSNPETLRWLEQAKTTPGVRVERLEDNQGIAGGQRELLRLADGEWFVPIDSDDFLTIDALATLATTIRARPNASVLYSDEFKSNAASEKFAPFFKPDFDPLMITNCCYPGHLMAMRTSHLRGIGSYSDDRATWCHDWDTVLRGLPAGVEPIHVPHLLYGWRIIAGSTASDGATAKPATVGSQRFVLDRHLEALGLSDRLEVRPNRFGPSTGMWSIYAREPVAGVVVRLDAEALWMSADPAATLREAAAGGAWTAILLDTSDDAASAALLALSAPALLDRRVRAVAGLLTDATGARVAWSGGVFTSNGVLDPSAGEVLRDGGYHGRLYCQRCVDAAPAVNVLIADTALTSALDRLAFEGERVDADSLMIMLGMEAARDGALIGVTPQLQTPLPVRLRGLLPLDRAGLLRRGDALTSRWYSADLSGLTPYEPSDFASPGEKTEPLRSIGPVTAAPLQGVGQP